MDDDYCGYRRCSMDVDLVARLSKDDLDYTTVKAIDVNWKKESKNALPNVVIVQKRC